MAKQIVISESEILEELRAAWDIEEQDPPGAFVVSELAKKAKRSERTVRAQVKALDAKGRIEKFWVRRKGSDGRRSRVRAYRIIKEEKKARS